MKLGYGLRETVFNLEVEGSHTFHVGQSQALVHNYGNQSIFSTGRKGRKLGDRGEAVARGYYKSKGHKILGSVQNRSGHGIDLVTRNPQGKLHFVEVKITRGRHAPSLSRQQKRDPYSYVESRLNRAIRGKGHWRDPGDPTKAYDPGLRRRAQGLLEELRNGGAFFEQLSVREGRAAGERIVRQIW